MRPNPYDPILASARRRPELWRVGVLMILAFGMLVAVTPLFYAIIGVLAPDLRPIDVVGGQIVAGATPQGLFVIFAAFALMIGFSVRAARRLHDRSLRDLTGPAAALRADFGVTLRAVLIVTALTFLIPMGEAGGVLDSQLRVPVWLLWLPLALIGLLVQVTAEELFFRGYLQSQIAAATGSYLSGLLASALIFGLAHYNVALSGAAVWFPVVWAFFFGLAVGDLTARTGTLGPAIALHLVNNLAATLIAPPAGLYSGFGLYTRALDLNEAYTDPAILGVELLVLLISWLAARLALRR